MKSTAPVVFLAILAAAISSPLVARERKDDSQQHRKSATDTRTKPGVDLGFQEVLHSAPPSAPGNGWRYFTNPAGRRAVVISPQGDYYYSRGNGLHWIAAEQI